MKPTPPEPDITPEESFTVGLEDVPYFSAETVQRLIDEAYAAGLEDAAPVAQQPLSDDQCDAIYMALNDWAREFDAYEFGLPEVCGGGVQGGREIIRNAISGVKP